MDSTPSLRRARAAHARPTVAAWPRMISVGARLALTVAVSVAVVIGSLTFIGLRYGEKRLEDDLRETARVTAAAVADDLELRPDPITGEAIAPTLHEFVSAAPSLQSITVFRADHGRPSVIASTSSAPPSRDALVARALEAGAPVWQAPRANTVAIAVPVLRNGRPAAVVVVAVSLTSVAQLRRV